MSVSQYLDLAYAVVVEEHVRRGASLFDALDSSREFAAGGGETQVPASGNNSVQAQPPANVEAQNDASLQQLESMMAGLSGGFR